MEKGNYMKKVAVQEFIARKSGKKSNIKLPVYYIDELGFSEYWLVNDLKKIIPSPLFKEMECNVTTYMTGVK